MSLTAKMTAITAVLTVVTLQTPHVWAYPASSHSWRYVFPFFPAELDVLVGHLKTTVKRLEAVLDKCQDMAEGEYKGGKSPMGVMRLSGPGSDTSKTDMEKKVEQILKLRETISELEDDIEECRFHFWTGSEVD